MIQCALLQVVGLLYSYVALLASAGPQQYIYDEEQATKALDFRQAAFVCHDVSRRSPHVLCTEQYLM